MEGIHIAGIGNEAVKSVLMVGPQPPPFGGVWSVMNSIVHSDIAQEYHFDLFPRADLTPGTSGLVERNLIRARRFLAFFQKIRSDSYAFVHIQSPDNAFLGTVAFMAIARLLKVPVLLHQHGTDWDYFYAGAPLLRRTYTRMGLMLPKRMIVLFQEWADHVERVCPGAQVRALRNLVHETGPVGPEQIKKIKHKLAIGNDEFIVVSVGSVGRRKGSFDIVAAAPEVAAHGPSVRFVLVGGEEHPGEMEQLQAMVKEKHAGAWVQFTGEVAPQAVPEYLAVADVFVLPSSVEGMPISILEAMQSSLPIITAPVSAIPEVIEHERSGLFVRPGSPAEIAQAVLRLRQDDALRTRLGRAARTVFEERFAFSRGIEEIRRLYAEMTA